MTDKPGEVAIAGPARLKFSVQMTLTYKVWVKIDATADATLKHLQNTAVKKLNDTAVVDWPDQFRNRTDIESVSGPEAKLISIEGRTNDL